MIKKIEINQSNSFPKGFPFVFNFILKLKTLYRQGWLNSDIPEPLCESVADHSYSLALLCLYYIPKYPISLNSEIVLKTALIHDIAEAVIGDFTPSDSINSKDKFKKESDTFISILHEYPEYEEWYELWLNFEKGSTPEGFFVKNMDKIEMLMQTVAYHKQTETDLISFFQSTKILLNDEFFLNIYEELLTLYQT